MKTKCQQMQQMKRMTEISQYHQRQVAAIAMTSVTPTSASHTITAKMNKRRLIDDLLFVVSLDRTNTTPRQAMHIALKAVGVNVNDMTLCTISVYEAHKKTRSFIGGIRGAFSPKTPLVAYFDGKLLLDNEGVNADRLAVVVSCKGSEKLLAIPKLPGSGTGVLMGNKVVEILRQWEGVPDWLAGLCLQF